MDYGKTGAAKAKKGAPRFDAHKTPAKAGSALKDRPGKDALLARMKAAASKSSEA